MNAADSSTHSFPDRITPHIDLCSLRIFVIIATETRDVDEDDREHAAFCLRPELRAGAYTQCIGRLLLRRHFKGDPQPFMYTIPPYYAVLCARLKCAKPLGARDAPFLWSRRVCFWGNEVTYGMLGGLRVEARDCTLADCVSLFFCVCALERISAQYLQRHLLVG